MLIHPILTNLILTSDGIGDVCDSCPEDFDNDIDGDGICGDIDNCVDDPNTNQSDVDSDGIGDICDAVLKILIMISMGMVFVET